MTASRDALWPALIDHSRHGDTAIRTLSARGTRIEFDSGWKLCGTSGLWNVNLGYGNEVIAEAITHAAQDASYLSVFRHENAYARRAAEDLVAYAGGRYPRVMFSTSGGAANDLAMKLARQFHAVSPARNRDLFVSLDGSFHGLTFGGFALTGEDLGQATYGVDTRTIRHVPPNDPQAITDAMRRFGNRVAAVVVEPVLGTGAVVLDDEFIDTLLDLRELYGFLLVADEVATGFWRTGRRFASDAWSSAPDVLITSKALTNGTCAGAAVLVGERIDTVFAETGALFVHGETQAGTPITCAAISATLAEIDRLDIAGRAPTLATGIIDRVASFVADSPIAVHHKGIGAMHALAFAPHGEPLDNARVPELVARIRDAGAVVHPGPSGVQLLPALVYSEAELDELFAAISTGLTDVLADDHTTVSVGAPC
ncbi:aminotransferase class III-fold pyridoxal phosphate-dependent enzyme [Williamsia herbipolensis]|uniref:Aminotransferase class III-fold pyridoxal phosphate-dependent enzyme n=1 Tax=Williamsia herbipolensis TaxID=1603258 RepID=A0AAU4K170_9NOCA|nr:daptide-type RiPP biosynthesis aminotransferase [Williamsia herbipolensis]